MQHNLDYMLRISYGASYREVPRLYPRLATSCYIRSLLGSVSGIRILFVRNARTFRICNGRNLASYSGGLGKSREARACTSGLLFSGVGRSLSASLRQQRLRGRSRRCHYPATLRAPACLNYANACFRTLVCSQTLYLGSRHVSC